jgi:hypothetical protein
MLGGRDVTDTPIDFDDGRQVTGLEIIVSQKQTELAGTVVDAKGDGVSEYVTVVFSEDRQRWTAQSRHVAAGRPDQRGRFKIVGLPPGRYRAAAVDYLEAGAERDPAVLDRLATAATPLTIAEDEPQNVILKLLPSQ